MNRPSGGAVVAVDRAAEALAGIVDEAGARWELEAVRLIHRVGEVRPQDAIVLVAVASAHRVISILRKYCVSTPSRQAQKNTNCDL